MMQEKESGYFFRIILLSFISLTTSPFTVKRYGEGDWFKGAGNIKCDELSAYMDSSGSGCRCRYGKTLSTENELMCRTYKERAFYRFQRKEIFNAYVTEVHTDCTANGFCTLISTAAKAELPIEKSLYNIPLNTESGCEVNFVEIIHDCIPRCVDLKFVFESHDSYSTDYLYLYLQLNRPTVQLDYLEGELFQADVSCRADNTNGKLLFKFSGTRILSNNGSFPNIPPYNRSATYCSTDSESHPDALIIGASAGSAVILVIILVFMVICCIRCRGFCRCRRCQYKPMPTGDIDIGNT